MTWALLALLTALCETGRDLATRHLLRPGGLSARLVMGLTCVLVALAATPVAVLLAPPPRWSQLLSSLAATAVVNGVAFWAYGRSLARGDLSLVLPLINLSPVVLLLSGWLLVGERPSPAAVLGVLLVVAGALQLGRGAAAAGPRGALGLWHRPGVRPMLLVAVLWGIGAGIDKLGVLAGGTLAWVAGLHLVVGLPLLSLALATGEGRQLRAVEAPRHRWRWLLLVALLALTGTGLQMEALRRTAVVHVIAIKRLSTLLGALVGVVWLGEPSGSLRLPGALLMLAGALLVLASAR
ncbi:MAG: EamA family transporter [Synechococcaceae cyanobacterium]|nr:EamA family transporter [Synechococcaceae cyanobacterium]